jgi:hypothetical protein
MLKVIIDWFRRPDPKAFAPAVQPEAVPYKVETPVQVAPTLAPTEVGKPADNRVEATTPVKPATPKPAARKPATPKPAAQKPAAMKAPAKKPPVKNTRAKKPNQ